MMIITESEINDAFYKLDSSKENPFEGIFELMDIDQPSIIDYLYEVEGDEFSEDERGMLLNIAIIAWYVLNEEMDIKPKIEGESLDSQLERNTSLFDEEGQNNDDIDEETMKLFSKFNKQPELMEFLVNLVLETPHDYEGKIRKEMILVLLMHIKTVVDVLVNNVEE